METRFNFKSQICTSVEQSRRLLALGLKKETADMVYEPFAETSILVEDSMWDINCDLIIPAWSLHRLISLVNIDNIKIAINEKDCWGGNVLRISQRKSFDKGNLYDNICDCIEWLIKEGYFNKEYLENGN